MGMSRAVGRMMLRAAAQMGYGANKAIRWLKSAGVSYRRQDMLADIRKFTGRLKYQANIEKMSGDRIVPRPWMVETELKQPRAYRVFGNATYLNPSTGKYETKRVSLYSDSLMTNDEFEKEYIEKSKAREYEGNSRVVGFRMQAIGHDKRRGY